MCVGGWVGLYLVLVGVVVDWIYDDFVIFCYVVD